MMGTSAGNPHLCIHAHDVYAYTLWVLTEFDGFGWQNDRFPQILPSTNPLPMAIFPGNDGMKVDVEPTHG